jgi:hypothetical protein
MESSGMTIGKVHGRIEEYRINFRGKFRMTI